MSHIIIRIIVSFKKSIWNESTHDRTRNISMYFVCDYYFIMITHQMMACDHEWDVECSSNEFRTLNIDGITIIEIPLSLPRFVVPPILHP